MKNNPFEPRVSIVIPVYNGENYLHEAIESALKQTYKNLEIIVVNDGSTDKTEEIALSYGNQIKYFSKENGGVSTALNLGIEKMTGEYFSWLSHDDLYNKKKIRAQINALKNVNNKDTVISCYHLVIDSNRYILKWLRTVDNRKNYDKENALNYLFNGYIQGCDLLISKNIFAKYGFFNIDLPTTQDYDLWFRIFRYEKLLIIPKYLVYYRSHPEQNSNINKDHINECDKLWIGFDDRLTINEKIIIYGSEIDFFKRIYFHLSENLVYKEAINYYKLKLIQVTKNNEIVSYESNVLNKQKIIKNITHIKVLYIKFGLLLTICRIYNRIIFILVSKIRSKV